LGRELFIPTFITTFTIPLYKKWENCAFRFSSIGIYDLRSFPTSFMPGGEGEARAV